MASRSEVAALIIAENLAAVIAVVWLAQVTFGRAVFVVVVVRVITAIASFIGTRLKK